MVTQAWIAAWRRLFTDEWRAFVLFAHGTCVALKEPGQDPARQAAVELAEWGPVRGGSPAGDMLVTRLGDGTGWVVACHREGVLGFVAADEVEPAASNDLKAGLLARERRHRDAHELKVIHVEAPD
ncbi:MAG: hypothetical protein EYC70_06150 [Planctomycetota bacterium]|nr:MAG: hypothetical protein EYC70_06150 [Planctomycetota bacterium]